METSRFSPILLSRGPSWGYIGPFRAWDWPLRLKIDPCRPDTGPPEHVNCLFSLNIDSERFQYLIVRIENGPPGSERGWYFTPFTPPPWLRHWLSMSLCICFFVFLFSFVFNALSFFILTLISCSRFMTGKSRNAKHTWGGGGGAEDSSHPEASFLLCVYMWM